MKTACIIFGALRQASLCVPTWKAFNFPVDYHLVTWDKTQQARVVDVYPIDQDLEDLKRVTGDMLSSITVLDYEKFQKDYPAFHYGSRMWYHWYKAAELLKGQGYERVILCRNDMVLWTTEQLNEAMFDVADNEIMVDNYFPDGESTNDWFFVMRWNTFEKFAEHFNFVVGLNAHVNPAFSDIHKIVFDYFKDNDLKISEQRFLQLMVARPPSRVHAGKPFTRELYQQISEEFNLWNEWTAGKRQ